MDHLTGDDALKELTPILSGGRLNAFVGSGISHASPSKLPTWSELIKEFITFFEQIVEDQAKGIPGFYSQLRKLADDAKDPRNATKHVEVASTLKEALLEFDDAENLGLKDEFTKWLQARIYNAKHNKLHSLIVGTSFSYILTTNYDLLLEQAQVEAGISKAQLRSISYTEPKRLAEAIYNRQSAIVYVHGHVGSIPLGEFVFTAPDYAKMLHHAHPGLEIILRNLFLSYNTLFLGYGGVDPHIESIREALVLHFGYGELKGVPANYEVIVKKNVDSVLKRYKKARQTKLIVLSDYAEYESFLTALQSIAPRK
jgi:hypothetical protein